MNQPVQCVDCGAVLPPGLPKGLCPNCACRAALGMNDAAMPESSVPAAQLPREFGDYTLLEEIARGGMGVVYKAWQKSLDRIVAVKMIRSGQFAGKEEILRFRAEAESAARLQHPNIVRIHETGEVDGQPFFSMDYVDGSNLAALVREKPLSPKPAAACVKKIAEAIHYAHEQGILHRDLKPSNVLIDQAGDPRITDFGLAKRMTRESFLTVTGHLMGSPNFMPPEQAGAKGMKAGRYSDVYGLGAILFYLITARAPFVAETMTETLHDVLNTEPVSPRLLNPSVPVDVATICLKCLEKEPAKRYAAAEKVARELNRFLNDEPIQARPVSRVELAWRWCRRKPALAISFGLTITLLLVLGIGGPIAALRIRSSQRRAEESVYIANVHQSFEALDSGDLLRAREFLQRIDESPFQRAIRGWEWRHLVHHARGDQQSIIDLHETWIAAVAPSPDRRLLGMIGEDGVVKLWDAATWEMKAGWRAHMKALKKAPDNLYHALAFTPDGATLITAGQDNAIRFWDVHSGKLVREIPGLANSIIRLAVSRDGRFLAGGTYSGNLSLWRMPDANSPEPEHLAEWKTEVVVLAGLDFSPDASILFAGGVMATPIQRFDLTDPQSPRALSPLAGSFPPFAISPDGQWFIAASATGVSSFHIPQLTPGPAMSFGREAITALSFAPDDPRLAVGLSSGEIRLLDFTATNAAVKLLGHEGPVAAVAFVQSGRNLELVSGSADKSVRRWDASLKQRRELALSHPGPVMALNFSPDCKSLATVSVEAGTSTPETPREEFALHLWDLTTRSEVVPAVRLRRKGSGGLVAHVNFSSDGKQLATDHYESLQFYEVPSLKFLAQTGDRCAVFAPDGGWLAYIDRWNRITKRSSLDTKPETLIKRQEGICRLAGSPDGKMLATSSFDGLISLWNASDGHPLVTLTGHLQRVVSMAFSPNSAVLASAGWDGRLGIWDVKTGRGVFRRGHQDSIFCVVFSPDGRTLATSGRDRTVRLWNVAHRQEVAILRGHTGTVCEVAFSPDGRWLASASEDATVRLWEAPPSDQ